MADRSKSSAKKKARKRGNERNEDDVCNLFTQTAGKTGVLTRGGSGVMRTTQGILGIPREPREMLWAKK